MGRPSKYTTNVLPRLEEIAAWARDGVSDIEMARNCGVSNYSWFEYKKQYPEFSSVLARSKNYIDNVVVVNAYLKRITGYDVDEPVEEYTIVYDEEGQPHEQLKRIVHKKRHIPGDPRAAEFWLARRQGKDWPMNVAAKATSDDNDETGIILIPAVGEVNGDLEATT